MNGSEDTSLIDKSASGLLRIIWAPGIREPGMCDKLQMVEIATQNWSWLGLRCTLRRGGVLNKEIAVPTWSDDPEPVRALDDRTASVRDGFV